MPIFNIYIPFISLFAQEFAAYISSLASAEKLKDMTGHFPVLKTALKGELQESSSSSKAITAVRFPKKFLQFSNVSSSYSGYTKPSSLEKVMPLPRKAKLQRGSAGGRTVAVLLSPEELGELKEDWGVGGLTGPTPKVFPPLPQAHAPGNSL